jgi:threonine dehydrogenase-like Zn-dependent dehydrogenase
LTVALAGKTAARGTWYLELRRGVHCSRGLLVSPHSEDVEIVIAAIFQARPEDPRQGESHAGQKAGIHSRGERVMKAIVYGGPGNKAWEDVPEPGIQDPTDAIVKVECTTICGTDLHILKGDVPAVTEGRILGHEGVGVVTEVGPSCTGVTVGDQVIISCISKCMECEYCKAGLTSHCQTLGGIGWIFGHLIDGTQAEYVRVPYADNGLIPLPDTVTAEQGTMLSDILPTGYEIGVVNGGG